MLPESEGDTRCQIIPGACGREFHKEGSGGQSSPERRQAQEASTRVLVRSKRLSESWGQRLR